MVKSRFKGIGIAICSIALVLSLVACGAPAPVSGKYHTSNLGVTFSDFEFSGSDQVTLYCAGFKNAEGTYKVEGSHYLVTITKHEKDSNYYGFVKDIKENCNILVTPKDENTISVEIKAKESGYIYAGQLGAEEYTKVKK